MFLDPAITREFVDLQKERLDECYLTGTLHLNMPKHGTKYPISENNEKLIGLFLDYKDYGLNVRDNVGWVVRRYLHNILLYLKHFYIFLKKIASGPRIVLIFLLPGLSGYADLELCDRFS